MPADRAFEAKRRVRHLCLLWGSPSRPVRAMGSMPGRKRAAGPASAAAAPLNDLNCTVPDFQNCSQFTKMNDLANSKAYAMQAQRKKSATGRPHSRPGCWSATTTAAILPPPNCPPQLAAASCMLSSAEQADCTHAGNHVADQAVGHECGRGAALGVAGGSGASGPAAGLPLSSSPHPSLLPPLLLVPTPSSRISCSRSSGPASISGG